jgi:hypothetical protein
VVQSAFDLLFSEDGFEDCLVESELLFFSPLLELEFESFLAAAL